MFTRKDYLEGRCDHRAYYAQFVSAGVRQCVAQSIGVKCIRASADPYFNDIPLPRWDSVFQPIPAGIASALRAAGDYPTLAGAVCIAKEAARQIKEEISR